MTYILNSIEARDVASLVHMQTNLRKHQQEGPLVIKRGEGCRVFDNCGRDYIEGVAGLWCASLGFNSERLAKVAYEQMRRLGYYHLYRHRSTESAVELAEELLKIAPVPMARVLFQCSGSEANDTAIKLAWYYWDAVGKPQRTKIIARQMAYHGNTCAAVSLSGKPDMHAGFGLPFTNFKHTEFPHYYRRHEPGDDVRGVGLIVGMELMQDCNRRIPFDSALKVGPRVDAAATRHGLILRVVGDRLVLAPPLIIEVDEINEIGRRLRRALDEVANDLASKTA